MCLLLWIASWKSCLHATIVREQWHLSAKLCPHSCYWKWNIQNGRNMKNFSFNSCYTTTMVLNSLFWLARQCWVILFDNSSDSSSGCKVYIKTLITTSAREVMVSVCFVCLPGPKQDCIITTELISVKPGSRVYSSWTVGNHFEQI